MPELRKGYKKFAIETSVPKELFYKSGSLGVQRSLEQAGETLFRKAVVESGFVLNPTITEDFYDLTIKGRFEIILIEEECLNRLLEIEKEFRALQETEQKFLETQKLAIELEEIARRED